MPRSLKWVFLAGALILSFHSFLGSGHRNLPDAESMQTHLESETGRKASEPLCFAFQRKLNAEIQIGGDRSVVMKESHQGEVILMPLQGPESLNSYLVSFVLHSNHPVTGEKKVLRRSHLPVEVRFSSDFLISKLLSIGQRNRETTDDLNLVRDLLTNLAFRGSEDTTGVYEAEWEGRPPLQMKRKIRYLDPALETTRILDSFHEIRQNESGIPLELRGWDRTRVPISKSESLETVSSYRFTLRPIHGTDVVSSLPLNPQLRTEVGMKLDPGAPREDQTLQSEEIPKLEELSKKEHVILFHRMLALLEANPERLRDFGADYLGDPARDDRIRFGVGVLASLNQPEAQKILFEAYPGFEGRPDHQHMILNALATSDVDLTEASKNFLLGFPIDEENVNYVLGSSLRKSPDLRVRDRLISLFYASTREEGKIVALEAIGNSGDVAFEGVLREALRSSSERIREKAAFGTRFFPNEIKESLLRSLEQDGSPRVRRAARDARGFYHES